MTRLTDDQVNQRARDLTSKAEGGGNVSSELNAIPFQDRARIAHQMENYNNEDLGSGATKAKLDIEFKKDDKGDEHVTHIERVGDPHAWLMKEKSPAYDMSAIVQGGFTDSGKLSKDRNESYMMDPSDSPPP